MHGPRLPLYASRFPHTRSVASSAHLNIHTFDTDHGFSAAIARPLCSLVFPQSLTTSQRLIHSEDAPGPTFLAYTPNGKKLITTGVDNFCRVFTTGSNEEPSNIDDCQENNLTIAAGVGGFGMQLHRTNGANTWNRMGSSSLVLKTER